MDELWFVAYEEFCLTKIFQHRYDACENYFFMGAVNSFIIYSLLSFKISKRIFYLYCSQ